MKRFPALRLRRVGSLLDLPWELPLADWPPSLQFRVLPIGPSRHLVRFLVVDGDLIALKEEPDAVAEREYAVLGHLERANLPAVLPIGIARRAEDQTAILVTEYLASSLQFRRLLSRFPLGAGAYRDRLLDAMAWLLVDLHRGGVYWGDCSLANTLFRRDGDRIQAFLVDAETSEVHPALSDGQRAYVSRSSSRTSAMGSRTWRCCRAVRMTLTMPSTLPRTCASATTPSGASCTSSRSCRSATATPSGAACDV